MKGFEVVVGIRKPLRRCGGLLDIVVVDVDGVSSNFSRLGASIGVEVVIGSFQSVDVGGRCRCGSTDCRKCSCSGVA